MESETVSLKSVGVLQDFLVDLGARKTPHSGRSLYDHLWCVLYSRGLGVSERRLRCRHVPLDLFDREVSPCASVLDGALSITKRHWKRGGTSRLSLCSAGEGSNPGGHRLVVATTMCFSC